MSTPLVSIVIPVYNGSDYLKEAIDSALSQTYQNVEVIVMNDGSNDNGKTRDIALSYGPRIIYLEKENGGVATALNAGIKAARGKYISWLSHDDAYSPEKLELQVPIMEKFEAEGRKALVYSSVSIMNESSVIYMKYDLPEVPPERFYEALLFNMVFDTAFKTRPFSVHGCSLLIPKELFNEIGYFDESRMTTQDFDLWFKAINEYDFVGMIGYLVRSRVHKGQGTYVLRKERVEEVDNLYLRAFNLYRPDSDRFDLDLPRAVLAFKLMNRRKAYSAAIAMLRGRGFSLRSWSYIARSTLATPLIMKGRYAARYGMAIVRKKLKGT